MPAWHRYFPLWLTRLCVPAPVQGVKLHCIIDACHSGSVMDLPFQAHVRGGYASWEASYHFTRSHKGTAGGFAVQFGASKDSQTAADTKALSGMGFAPCSIWNHRAKQGDLQPCLLLFMQEPALQLRWWARDAFCFCLLQA